MISYCAASIVVVSLLIAFFSVGAALSPPSPLSFLCSFDLSGASLAFALSVKFELMSALLPPLLHLQKDGVPNPNPYRARFQWLNDKPVR